MMKIETERKREMEVVATKNAKMCMGGFKLYRRLKPESPVLAVSL
jgi:hypothetical protein